MFQSGDESLATSVFCTGIRNLQLWTRHGQAERFLSDCRAKRGPGCFKFLFSALERGRMRTFSC